MESVDGIEQLHMSGARAVFTIEDGEQVSREDLASAFEEQDMELSSYEKQVRPRAKERYLVDAGIT